MHNVKPNKSVGPYSISTKIMKISKEIISLSLSQLINDSIFKGLLPNTVNYYRSYLFLKMTPYYFVLITDQLLFFSNMSKIFEKVIRSILNSL